MEFNDKELDYVLSAYITDRKKLKGLWSFEEYCEFFVRRCQECGEIFILAYESYNTYFCSTCHRDSFFDLDKDFEYFDREKERIYYGLK